MYVHLHIWVYIHTNLHTLKYVYIFTHRDIYEHTHAVKAVEQSEGVRPRCRPCGVSLIEQVPLGQVEVEGGWGRVQEEKGGLLLSDPEHEREAVHSGG